MYMVYLKGNNTIAKVVFTNVKANNALDGCISYLIILYCFGINKNCFRNSVALFKTLVDTLFDTSFRLYSLVEMSFTPIIIGVEGDR